MHRHHWDITGRLEADTVRTCTDCGERQVKRSGRWIETETETPAEIETFEVHAAYDADGFVTHVQISVTCPTRERADEIVAMFPKSCKLKSYRVSSDPVDYAGAGNWITLWANGVNGGVNETGLKRYRAIVAKARALGFYLDFEYRVAANGVKSEAELEERLARAQA